jgi:hypothetical protein
VPVWLHCRVTTRSTSAFAALATAGILAAGLTSCSSGGDTNGQGAAGGPTPSTPAQLGAKLLAGYRSISSAHLVLDISLAGTTVHGAGDEKVSRGKLTAMNLTESLPTGGSIQVILVGGKTYAKLPAQANTSGKPYVLVTPQSSNPIVQQLAGSLNTALSAASIKTYDTFVRAAKSIKVDGRETVDGVGTTHYSVVVDVSKLPNTQALAASGVKTVPFQMWVDDQGRPVKVTENLHVQGKSLNVVSEINRYNQPVTITAPPANEVSTN